MAIRRIVCRDRAEWLQARRVLGVGASESAAILGHSRFASAAEVYYSKRKPVQDGDADEPGYLWWGLRLEPAIAERYAIETGNTVEDTGDYTIFVDDEKPWRFATLDRWVVEFAGPLELKNMRGLMRRYWSDGVPLEVQIQAQQQMAVMGSERAAVATLTEGSDFAYYHIERHQPFIDLLDERTRLFWDQVQRGEVPIDGDRRTRDIINEQYEARAKTIVLPTEAAVWDRERQQATEAIKAAEAVKNEAESRIILALGDANTGVINGVTWKRTLVKGSSYTVNRADSYRLSRSEKR